MSPSGIAPLVIGRIRQVALGASGDGGATGGTVGMTPAVPSPPPVQVHSATRKRNFSGWVGAAALNSGQLPNSATPPPNTYDWLARPA